MLWKKFTASTLQKASSKLVLLKCPFYAGLECMLICPHKHQPKVLQLKLIYFWITRVEVGWWGWGDKVIICAPSSPSTRVSSVSDNQTALCVNRGQTEGHAVLRSRRGGPEEGASPRPHLARRAQPWPWPWAQSLRPARAPTRRWRFPASRLPLASRSQTWPLSPCPPLPSPTHTRSPGPTQRITQQRLLSHWASPQSSSPNLAALLSPRQPLTRNSTFHPISQKRSWAKLSQILVTLYCYGTMQTVSSHWWWGRGRTNKTTHFRTE